MQPSFPNNAPQTDSPGNGSQTDALLMQRLRDHRDEAALCALIARYQGPVYALAFRMLRNAAEAEDIAQRTYIRVWKAAGSYEASAKFSTWLFTIARHLIFNETRRRLRKPVTSLNGGPESTVEATDTRTAPPDTVLSSRELERAVDAALDHLPPKARMAIQLRRFDNKNYEEIAAILGITVPATKSLLFRARQELRRLLQPYL